MPDRFQRPINGRKPVEAERAERTDWARAPKGGGPVFGGAGWGLMRAMRHADDGARMREGFMCRRIAAPDEGEWGWHRPLTLMPMEGALSFLGRLAQAKAAPSTAAFCTDQALRYDDLRRGEPQAVARLAAWGGIEPERLLHQTCRRISETEVEFLGFTFPESVLVLTQNRACPGCLRDDTVAGGPQAMHGRLFWMLRSFRTCPRHRLAIQTLPQAAEGRVYQDMIGDIRPLREQILGGALDTPVVADPVLERHLLDRLAGLPTTRWLDSLARMSSRAFPRCWARHCIWAGIPRRKTSTTTASAKRHHMALLLLLETHRR